MTVTSITVSGQATELLWARSDAVPRRRDRRLERACGRSIDNLHHLLIGGCFEMSPHAEGGHALSTWLSVTIASTSPEAR